MLTYVIGIVLIATLVLQWKYTLRQDSMVGILAFRTPREILLFLAGAVLSVCCYFPLHLPPFSGQPGDGLSTNT